jgi:carbonic anhydrase
VGEILPDHWTLKTCEYNVPSQHSINGVYADAERTCWFDVTNRALRESKGDLHVVRLAVVEFLRVGTSTSNTDLSLSLNAVGTATSGSILLDNPIRIDLTKTIIYSYAGTELTPPCERTHWLVKSTNTTISEEHLQKLTKILRGTTTDVPSPTSVTSTPAATQAASFIARRPQQPLADRPVHARTFFAQEIGALD